MRLFLLTAIRCLLLSCLAFLQSNAQPYWQQEVRYAIDVTLHDKDRTLDGICNMQYTNHSPDTLSFIWIHCWPNAYKNDKTAFCDQLLGNGNTSFYFSDREQKGYINHLNFRVDGVSARAEDHPQYIDIVRLVLPQPLPPGNTINITTPFHVKLPYNFSRGGYHDGTFQITQWYPKPAVYDRNGWHPYPYLDQGEFYQEFGSFDVHITLPAYYTVAATGTLQDSPGKQETAAERNIRHPLPLSNRSAGNHKTSTTRPTLRPVTSQFTKLSHKSPQPPDRSAGNHPKKPSPAFRPNNHNANNPASRSTAPNANNPASISAAPDDAIITSSATPGLKTLHYIQENVHDFAWFADPNFIVNHDTLQLPSGKVIDLYAFYTPDSKNAWHNCIQYMKDAVLFRSALIGEYPFEVVTAAEAAMGSPGGMEYPTIAHISPEESGKSLDMLLEHEIGHNWFYGILGSDERRYPWMDEGLNTYYDDRYEAWKYGGGSISTSSPPSAQPHSTSPHSALYPSSPSKFRNKPLTIKIKDAQGPRHSFWQDRWLLLTTPEDFDSLLINTLAKERRDQPISSSSDTFTSWNYDLIAYAKTAYWLRQLQQSLGTPLFDSCMRRYYQEWQFKHPSPDDFRNVMESTSHQDLHRHFSLLDTTGPLIPFRHNRKLRPSFLLGGRNTDRFDYLNIAPAIGYNMYDHLMAGILLHNYNLPPDNFRFFLAPLYAINSKQLTGIGDLSYTWYTDPRSGLHKIRLGLGASRFSTLSGADSNGNKIFGGFYKFTPSLRIDLANRIARSTMEKWIEWKTFLIGEKSFDRYVIKSTDSMSYPTEGNYSFRYLNQLTAHIEDTRILYPYSASLQIQQGAQFYRLNFTGSYFFNYAAGGGMDVRLFAAKFGYIGSNSISAPYLTRFQPKLTAVGGYEDYTYNNYFIGRSEYTGYASQQIMMRDGDLKIRVPSFPFLEGRSDNWVSSLNLSTTLPYSIIPKWVPLKLFLDIGTYAGGWQDNAPTSRFLYTGGIQLSLFKNILNVYAPLVYSSDFSDQLKTLPDQNTFWKKLSFSIDIQRIRPRTILPREIPL